MNVLICIRDFKSSFFDIPLDGIETGKDRVALLFRKDSLPFEHANVSTRAPNVLSEKLLIKSDGLVKIVYQLIGLFGEASAP